MKKSCILSILFTLYCIVSHAQTSIESLEVYFPQGKSAWSPSFRNNGANMQQFIERIREVEQRSASHHILCIHYRAAASPEGSLALNKRLSLQRAESITRYLKQHFNFPDSIVTVITPGEDWETLAKMVADSDMPYKQETLDFLNQMQQRIAAGESSETCKRELMKLHGGQPWQYMYRHFFPSLRRFTAHIHIGIRLPQEISPEELMLTDEPLELPFTDIPDIVIVEVPEPEPVVEPEPEPRHGWYLKTNGLALGMLITNIAAEFDVADHWSVTIPVYYSALNYFTSDIKFRTLCFQPDARYWFRPENNGFFVGAHACLDWFNYAKGGDYRYQDHFRHTPMIGGGLAAGYRKPISRNQRWHLEFSLGAGCYKLHYDVFHNEPNGKLIRTEKRTFFGIDNAAVTLAYKFNYKN